MKAGNSCLYFLQQFFNIFLVISGIIITVLGIYLWAIIKIFSFIEIVFLVLGGLQLFIGILAMSSKRSMLVMNSYISILAFIFLFQLTGTILGFYFKDQLVDKAVNFQASSQQSADQLRDLMDKHVSITMYTTLACLAIQLMCLVFSISYKDSLQNNNSSYHLVYNDATGRLMSLEETQKLQEEKVKSSTEQKRQELYTNNPEYYEWKLKQEKEQKAQNKSIK